MPSVTINDETVDAEAGETLLSVARRNAMHIGFLCDGHGMCQTCECHINSGAENLSPPSDIELNTMTKSRRDRGYRLACQTQVTGAGPVDATTHVEQLRRQTISIYAPPQGTSSVGNLGLLANHMVRFSLDYMSSLPYLTMKGFSQTTSKSFAFSDMQQWFTDTQRVIMRVATGGAAPAAGDTDEPIQIIVKRS